MDDDENKKLINRFYFDIFYLSNKLLLTVLKIVTSTY